ncbi:sigma-54-dependent transcriptional regulator [Lysobacter arvi]|uniref:Sigma-54 dependent transcriptional regulator n=1 Tax=Lysobacter arvi TaxID=3038776 RepID=A0ABU1C9C4_9GAMM|nr:sigma-54 dependent transcriptional regulator [Lysobacter arvi]MDR0181733.1 sigma-54 dependent transcriptional regulator [Lysobacter arvi]
MPASLLIVDDDRDFTASAADFARLRGFQPYVAHSIEQSRQFSHLPPLDLLLLDLELPDGNGMDLLDDPALPEHDHAVIVTGQPSVESAIQAVSRPVYDYLLKPLCPEQFDALLSQAAAAYARAHDMPMRFGMVGGCEAMRQVADDIERVAPSDASVLITGESGTGKELVARAVHQRSGRQGAFIAVNAGAISPELLASHLFGHERGSFTGANARHAGFFEQAHGGTLFLDEITEMPLALQVYLLRVLETGTVTRVGGSESIPVDVRIVAASNRDPYAAIESGALREDLYYRLADFTIAMPGLRERGEDVPLLAQHFLDLLNVRHGTNKRFADGTDRTLRRHAWPGNVRELRSAVQRAFLSSDDGILRVRPNSRRMRASDADPGSVVFTVGMTYAEIEHEMLNRTLAYFDNDRTRTARALGVSVRTIHNQLARLRTRDTDA